MPNHCVAILGAGTMGAGIAQVAAAQGWNVLLKDANEDAALAAVANAGTQWTKLVEKGRMLATQRDDSVKRLRVASDPAELAECEILIEAIIENLDIKTRALAEMIFDLNDDCIIATNTSSLSVTAIGEKIGEAHRTVGMHFFNPAPVMRLVEVIAGKKTDRRWVDRTAEIATEWGKEVARAADVPGFIVNHVARPYYLEAFRIVEDRYATPGEIDAAMKTLGAFRMGPLELTDLIGQDVNSATTRSVWEQLGKPPLLTPSSLQERLVAEGKLGRKSKRGVFDYSAERPASTLNVYLQEIPLTHDQRVALSAFLWRCADPNVPMNTGYVFSRILAAVIVQAHLAFERGVATKEDIDTAMTYGVNYPSGPFSWTQMIGAERTKTWLEALNAMVTDNRFATPKSLGA